MAPRKRMIPSQPVKQEKTSSPAPVDDDFNQRLKCAVCYDILRSPTYQLIPCSHKFCETCIKTWRYTHYNRKCPMCCKPGNQIARDHFVETILEKYYALNPNATKRDSCPPWEGSEPESSEDDEMSDDSGLTDSDIEVDVVRVTDIPEQARQAVRGARRLQTETQRVAAALEELRSLTTALERVFPTLSIDPTTLQSIDVITLGAQDEQVRVTVTPEPSRSRRSTSVPARNAGNNRTNRRSGIRAARPDPPLPRPRPLNRRQANTAPAARGRQASARPTPTTRPSINTRPRTTAQITPRRLAAAILSGSLSNGQVPAPRSAQSATRGATSRTRVRSRAAARSPATNHATAPTPGPQPRSAFVPYVRPARSTAPSTTSRSTGNRAATPIPAHRAAIRTRLQTPRRVRSNTRPPSSRTSARNSAPTPISRNRANDQIQPRWNRPRASTPLPPRRPVSQRTPAPAVRRSARIQALTS